MDFSVSCTLVSQQFGALLLSLLLEAFMAVIVGYGWWGHPYTLAMIAIAATLITHPFVWFLFAAGEEYLNYGLRLVFIELLVVGVEAVAFHWGARYPLRRSVLLSLMTNSASLLFGKLIFQVFGCE